MKKIISLLLVLIMMLSIVSCDTDGNTPDPDSNGNNGGNIFDDLDDPDDNGGNDNTDPDEPEHTHSFVDGKCKCGESDPDYKPEPEHIHAYEYALISYGEGFALEGHCTEPNCDMPTIIADEGLVPEYEHISPTCISEGSSTWSYTKEGVLYTLKVSFDPVENNHSYDDEKCIYCGTEKPEDQPTEPEHTHSWVDATCTTPKT